ncbi:hypothetical protein [Priestia aryabhattai]
MNLTSEKKKQKNKKFIKFYKKGYNDMTSLYLSGELKHYICSLEMEYIELGYNLEYQCLAIKINNEERGYTIYNGKGHLKDSIASTALYRCLCKIFQGIELCTPYEVVFLDEYTLAMTNGTFKEKEINLNDIVFTWFSEEKYKHEKKPRVATN